MNQPTGRWDWRQIVASPAFRKEDAIRRIKAQPFFRPRDDFYLGAQWEPSMIDAMRLDEHKPMVFNLIGVDLAKLGGDRTEIRRFNYNKAAWGEPVDDIADRAERDGMLDAKSRRSRAMLDAMNTADEASLTMRRISGVRTVDLRDEKSKRMAAMVNMLSVAVVKQSRPGPDVPETVDDNTVLGWPVDIVPGKSHYCVASRPDGVMTINRDGRLPEVGEIEQTGEAIKPGSAYE